jgi:predicted TIM-barrel fold metal-dependent hydrolase
MTAETRYETHMDLARLPYFELREGHRLALADPEFGPSIDCHTHLALAYVRPMQVDLDRLHPATEHYLPMYRPLDLDVYMNRNLTEEDKARMTRDLTRDSVTASGMRVTHTLPNLAREMADLDIAHSVLLPIDYPALSDNAGTYLQLTTGRREIICFGSVHPYAPGVEQKLDRQKALGARGIKVHPAVQLIKPDARRCMRLYELCADRGLPVLFHCGPVGIEPRLSRWLSQVRHYVRAIEEHPRTTFLLGHSGALQMEQALKLAREHDNVYLELASQSLSAIRRIVAEGPTDRVLMGSDWPFYHQATGLAKALLATEGDPALRRRVLYDNAATLFGI